MEKFGNRWMFVTPDGHAFWMLGVYAVDIDLYASINDQGVSYQTVASQKYRTKSTWGNRTLIRLKSWGFNTLAEYASSGYAVPISTVSIKMPWTDTQRFSRNSFQNRNNYAPGATKDLLETQDCSVFTQCSGSFPDVFDPNFDAFVLGWEQATQSDSYWSQTFTSAWVIGYAPDDTDDLRGFGPGTEILAPDGSIHPHLGWIALCASPTKSSSSKWGVTYPNPTVFTKQQLQRFLSSRYGGSIAALNAAWGSNYTTFGSAGGWTTGTGLMDENGRHTAWLGMADASLRNAAPAVVTDLNDFLFQIADKYFSVVVGRFKQFAPNKLAFGPAVLNSHCGLTWNPILKAASKWLDVLQAGICSQAMLDKTAQYFGDKPVVTWEGSMANPDSSLWRHPNVANCAVNCTFSTQADRAVGYSNKLNFLATTPAATTNTYTVVGFKWWQLEDSWGELANWGLVSFRDNAYDGKEAVMAPGTDSWGYPTGGEEKNYGDFISSVRNTNLNVLKKLLSAGP